MSFFDEIRTEDYDEWGQIIAAATPEDVQTALDRPRRTVRDFAALVSPAAVPFLPRIAGEAERLTRIRFGQTVNMYIPLYLSNICSNRCRYCGFAADNHFKRRILTPAETEEECLAIRKLGYETILVVTGESGQSGMRYFREVIPLIKRHAAYLMMEVQPLDTQDYRELREMGVDCVCVYQETYHEPTYRENHLGGRKTDMRYRMETPERLGEAGMDKIGMGILLGLAEFRTDAVMLARHIAYMRRHYWRSRLSLSFPRLRPAEGGFCPPFPVSERELLQYVCAFRLFDPELEISISTRESASFRDMIVPLVINSISAGSCTQPGGYARPNEEVPQFVINDDRPTEEIAARLRNAGLDVIWHSSRIGQA